MYILSELEHIVCRYDEGNQMSLTMLLRRSPDLDVETLGGMNLVSSSTVKGPEEAQSEEEPPEHVVSNDSHPYPTVKQSQQIHLKPVPRPRQAVFPHAIHLKDLAPVPWHDGLHLSETASSAAAEAEREQLKTQQAPLWHSALHADYANSTAADPAVPSSSAKGGVQAAAAAHTPKKNAYVHMCRWYPHVNARDAQAPFDLYQPSSKILECSKEPVLQTPTAVASSKPSVAGFTKSQGADSNTTEIRSKPEAQSLITDNACSLSADAVDHDMAHPMGPNNVSAMQNSADAAVSGLESAAESAFNPESEPTVIALGHPGSDVVGEPAVEGACETAAELAIVSAAEAASAAVAESAVESINESAEAAYDDPQGSYSVQEPALDSDSLLPHKSSSVRFLVALDSMTNSEATANSAAVTPEPVCSVNSIYKTISTEASREEGDAPQAANSKHAMRTVSSASAASLKSSLKSAHSSLSNAGSQNGTRGSLQFGVNFAGQGDEEDDGKAAESSTVKSGIVRGVPDAFPAWLTEGYVLS